MTNGFIDDSLVVDEEGDRARYSQMIRMSSPDKTIHKGSFRMEEGSDDIPKIDRVQTDMHRKMATIISE